MQRSTNNHGHTRATACAEYVPEIPQSVHHAVSFEAGTAKEVGIIESVETKAVDPLKALNTLCQANYNLLQQVQDIDLKLVSDGMNTFAEAGRVLVKGLDLLSQLHPFIGVATRPFLLVIKLDLARRDNEKKVFAVNLQIQELMKALLELRGIQDVGNSGITIAERLDDLIQAIAQDIKNCGSACDVYTKKSNLSKAIKSSAYESCFSDFATQFIKHRENFQLRLQVHTSVTINAIGKDVQAIERKLDHGIKTIQETMIALFRSLNTPQERVLHKLIEEHGGARNCLNDDAVLQDLVRKSGEVTFQISGRNTGKQSNDFQSIRKKLKKELAEDIDEAFKRNMESFEKKMERQSKQLKETIHSASNHIIQTFHAGAHDRISDPDLRGLWKDMGWKGSVKARHFVLNLHDFYTDKLSRAKGSNAGMIDRGSQAPPTPLSANPAASIDPGESDDNWALPFINAAYVQPISEAVDDDATGFISIKEVNTFVESCPKGWRLPHWFAYWAVGWQVSISRYKNRIYSLVQSMFQALEDVLPSNRQAVDEYLSHPSFWRIELLLRSTRSVNSDILFDQDLANITEMYSKAEEARIDANLEAIDYDLDEPGTVSLVTGEGRIERYVFPLICLLLQRHLKVIELSCEHVLSVEELVNLNQSLVSVLLSIDSRIRQLEAVFKQTHMDVQARLGNFAFGMFQLSYGDIRRTRGLNTLGTWDNPEQEELSNVDTSEDLKILKYGTQDGFQPTDYFEFESSEARSMSHPLQGTWTGRYSRFDYMVLEPVFCILRLSFQVSPDLQQITGKGEDYLLAFNFTGKYEYDGTLCQFSFDIFDDDLFFTACTGCLDIATNVMTLSFSDPVKRYVPEASPYQEVQLRQISPSLLQFRYSESQFAEDPVTSRWTFAYKAAIHQAKEKLLSRELFQARCRDRRRFVELTVRSLIVNQGWTPQTPLEPAEEDDLESLRCTLNPSEARFYQALAKFECQKLPLHHFIGCDSCSLEIIKSRMLCIQCMTVDLSDNIDLCSACIDHSPATRGFSHDPSHDMVRVEETLHDFHFAIVIEDARDTAKEVKTLFQSRKSMALSGRTTERETEKSARLACACCATEILTSCWACLVCEELTMICLPCDTQSVPPTHSSSHEPNHRLVRIHNTSTTASALASTEDRVISLQQQLAILENNLDSGLAAIDAKVEERLSRLEHRAELRFDTLETLLRKIGDQEAALAGISTQAV